MIFCVFTLIRFSLSRLVVVVFYSVVVCVQIHISIHRRMRMCACVNAVFRTSSSLSRERISRHRRRNNNRKQTTRGDETRRRYQKKGALSDVCPFKRTGHRVLISVVCKKDTQYQHLGHRVERQHFALDALVKTCRTRNDTADRKTITHGRHFTN